MADPNNSSEFDHHADSQEKARRTGRALPESATGDDRASSPPDLSGRVVAFLVAPEGAEEVELTDPWQAVVQAGGSPMLVSTVSGRVQTFQHLDRAGSYPVDETVSGTDGAEFDALVLPGGVANPDFLRTQEAAVEFVRRFLDSGRPVAAICHAPWLLIETGLADGRRLTSWPSLRTDLRNAGAHWQDEPVVICEGGAGPLITSRGPDDLPEFDHAFVHRFAAADPAARR